MSEMNPILKSRLVEQQTAERNASIAAKAVVLASQRYPEKYDEELEQSITEIALALRQRMMQKHSRGHFGRTVGRLMHRGTLNLQLIDKDSRLQTPMILEGIEEAEPSDTFRQGYIFELAKADDYRVANGLSDSPIHIYEVVETNDGKREVAKILSVDPAIDTHVNGNEYPPYEYVNLMRMEETVQQIVTNTSFGQGMPTFSSVEAMASRELAIPSEIVYRDATRGLETFGAMELTDEMQRHHEEFCDYSHVASFSQDQKYMDNYELMVGSGAQERAFNLMGRALVELG